ncbi:MAG: glycogen/starch/alpha-glucan phosphorylase, partial [Okeania sp. SIO1H5]|uniref:glycogen/starch/alpha-glucan family phosphorylase n=1 Tax=Okeania sp. SIO1H5 TaxID=2607777 RepID=UPI0013B97700
RAWQITTQVFAYTNHTLLPEALEKWSVDLMGNLLPRHLQIIFEINYRFLKQVSVRYPGDTDRLARMSLIEEGENRSVRMAFLAILGSRSVNGVAELHLELIKSHLVKDFYEFCPEKFNNKTNGITPRRWLKKSNPSLSALISEQIGDEWVRDLDQLRKLEPFANDTGFQARWREVKTGNKQRLAQYVQDKMDLQIRPDSLFDVQIKRFHEYKRQLMMCLHIIHLYHEIKAGKADEIVPRTFIFGGKAAPGYMMAKLIIKLINSVGQTVNTDPLVGDRLRVAFIPNYGVSLAEKIFPASDLSEQISTAGKEASGTGNMKFALNGALTIGTLDGANIEIQEEVGEENIFIFGLTASEVMQLKNKGYRPADYADKDKRLGAVLNLLRSGFFNQEEPDLFQPILDSLLVDDPYMILADFGSYIDAQEKVAQAFLDPQKWTQMAILNVARMGKFSSDRTIAQYNEEIWGSQAVPIEINR